MVLFVSLLLSGFVWRDLLLGGGIVGGDIYPYFFPQKVMLAEAFARGEIPLWHDRTALGYPLHAESQAGVFYPVNQVLYRICEVSTAYNLSIVLHYFAAFVLTWRFARTQKLSAPAAGLAAVIFVYGWFPARLSLEWSIVGGVWFPFCLWMTNQLLMESTFRRWSLLAVCFGVHLLAGHFTLAFITQLTCMCYAVLDRKRYERSFSRAMLPTGLAVAAGLLAAAVQLVPTYELQQQSQRDGSNPAFNPAYGHLPPVYLTQLFASWWYWHTPEMVLSREMMQYPWLMSDADSNQVEAHLYCGLIPFFMLCGMFTRRVRRRLEQTPWKVWAVLGGLALMYAFGWCVPLTKHIPGFGFFMGPGRYTIVTSLAMGLIAGMVGDALWQRKRGISGRIVLTGITALTLVDVLKSSENPVCDAQIVEHPPIKGLADSEIHRILKKCMESGPVRLLAGGANVANLYGVSSVPQYLGLGPKEYFDRQWQVQSQPSAADEKFPSEQQQNVLKRLSVSHILTTEAISASSEIRLLFSGPDAFLNRVWGRGAEPCYLYELVQSPGRITVNGERAESVTIGQQSAGEVQFEIAVRDKSAVTWNDLMFPGWMVEVDGRAAQAASATGFGRTVNVSAGRHRIRWIYQPTSFRIGVYISLVTIVVLFAANSQAWRWEEPRGTIKEAK